MAKVSYIHPIESISGKLNHKEKRGTIQRRKHYRDEKGQVIGIGANEAYIVINPRDYDKKPLTEGEKFNTSTFQQAILLAKQERENPERLAYWTERWKKQLEKGDPMADISKQTGKRKIYRRLDMFIQTMIQGELRRGERKL
ncbi:MAG: hypothetical protein MJZ48_01985 [Paludibacteraceae bacterium]|nr:hypothetical protein [Paludibacteraceae bacterium]